MLRIALVVFVAGILSLQGAETFSVITWNLHNYLFKPIGDRPVKEDESRKAIANTLIELKPDVLVVQEIGGKEPFVELQKDLAVLKLQHTEFIQGYDTNINLGILSRFPISSRRPHTNLSYVLGRQRFFVTRGFGEVNIQVNSNYNFTLLAAHLKSRRASFRGDEGDMRLQEAMLLRRIVEEKLNATPEANLLIAGDLNDLKTSQPVRHLLGQRHRLLDLRPEERLNGKRNPNVVWTYYYAAEDSYDRVDYILLSRGMAREIVREGAFVHGSEDWLMASDHRPVVVSFLAEDRKSLREQ